MLTIASISWFPLVALIYTVWLSAFVALPVAQTHQTTKAAARSANNQDAELKSLYDAHQWFRLRDVAQAEQAPVFYRGAVAATFNDIAQAEHNLQSVIKHAPKSDQAADARGLLIYVYQRAGRYRQALSHIEKALGAEPNSASLKNARTFFGALSRHPSQVVAERRFSSVRYSMKGGNILIPATINGKSANYIVDTGAAFSTISEAEAKRLGLPINETVVKGGDAAGGQVDLRTAFADRLIVGNVILRHVAFLVSRDDQQPFVDLPLGERGVLGLPVLLAFQTLRWKRDGTFEIGFPVRAKYGRQSNVCFEGAQPVIEAEFRQSKINMFLDTGAIHTRALPLFAKEFASFVSEFGRKDSARVTGVGNKVDVDAMTLPELTLRINGFDATLRPAQVLLKELTSDSRWWHVWAGTDLINQARVATLDFTSMTLALE